MILACSTAAIYCTLPVNKKEVFVSTAFTPHMFLSNFFTLVLKLIYIYLYAHTHIWQPDIYFKIYDFRN